MKVILRDIKTPDGRVNHSLTLGREYVVLGISGPYWRLLDDYGEPILFDLVCFEVTDPSEPAFWVSENEAGVRRASLPEWLVPGFFEKWHDKVESVQLAFAEQLAHWYPDHDDLRRSQGISSLKKRKHRK